MTNKTDQKAEHVSDIIQILNNGIEFYTDAQEKVDNPTIVGMFIIMADVRIAAVKKLQPFAVLEDGERERGHSFSVEARKVYSQLLTTVTSDKAHTYIRQLKEVEEKILEELKMALGKEQPSDCRFALLTVYSQIEGCYNKVFALQNVTA